MELTLAQYFSGHANSTECTSAVIENAARLIVVCNNVKTELETKGVIFFVNPNTNSIISGSYNGWGGFRTLSCKVGTVSSSHKEGLGVDLHDPDDDIDNYLFDDHAKNSIHSILSRHGLYIEHPYSTRSWSHWTIREPRSGNHIFYP